MPLTSANWGERRRRGAEGRGVYIVHNFAKSHHILSLNERRKKKRQNSTKRQNTRFPKESVGNVDLHKPVLNKIMTTNK